MVGFRLIRAQIGPATEPIKRVRMLGSGVNRKAGLEKCAGGRLGERKTSSLHYIMSCVVDIRVRFPQLTLALGRPSTQAGYRPTQPLHADSSSRYPRRWRDHPQRVLRHEGPALSVIGPALPSGRSPGAHTPMTRSARSRRKWYATPSRVIPRRSAILVCVIVDVSNRSRSGAACWGRIPRVVPDSFFSSYV